jgi:hypothetical protein
VGEERIGDFGLIAGGAAGLEVDRAAPELGTPANALVLALSRNLTNTYLIVPEEFLETAPGLGADENALARADVVFFAMREGGAVFSVGWMAWSGIFLPLRPVSTDQASCYSRFLRSTVSLFDPFQELLIIPLFDPVGLFGALRSQRISSAIY